ncbi:MAG: iron-sulfur cluster assembly accessory protein [Chloroflexi bacterium]|nr:iron-sulfur cluster assembly accessory protein [Chloroflexota bacterium]
MLQEINTQLLTLTPAASRAIKDILTERNLEGYALRVYVAGGGCCGVNFGMALDNNIRDQDMTFESDGIKVVVDEVSIDYLRDATVDFVNDPEAWRWLRGQQPILQSAQSQRGARSVRLRLRRRGRRSRVWRRFLRMPQLTYRSNETDSPGLGCPFLITVRAGRRSAFQTAR